MGIALATVHFPHMSGLPEDTVVNSFVFSDAVGTPFTNAVADAVSGDIASFYNDAVAAGGPHTVAHFLGDQLSRAANAVFVEWYQIQEAMHGEPHGSPFHTTTFTLGAMNPGAQGLPSELCVVCSIAAAPGSLPEESGSTRPRARTRGRIYLGPLSSIVFDSEAGTRRVRVVSAARVTIAGAAARLADATNATWCVWSRRNGNALPVVTGFVDDAFDIQRRRGERAVGRTTFG
jgi:hypothetical protein